MFSDEQFEFHHQSDLVQVYVLVQTILTPGSLVPQSPDMSAGILYLQNVQSS